MMNLKAKISAAFGFFLILSILLILSPSAPAATTNVQFTLAITNTVPLTNASGATITLNGNTVTWTNASVSSLLLNSRLVAATNTPAKALTNLFTKLQRAFTNQLTINYASSTSLVASAYLQDTLSANVSTGWATLTFTTNAFTSANTTVSLEASNIVTKKLFLNGSELVPGGNAAVATNAPDGSRLVSETTLPQSLTSGTNSATLINPTTTNRVGYFGGSLATATNREPYWTQTQGWGALGETHYTLTDSEGIGIIAVENKNQRRDRTFYIGSYSNRAMAYIISADPLGGSIPRMVWNMVEPTDPDLIRHQYAVMSNCVLIGSVTFGFSVAALGWDIYGNTTHGSTNSGTAIKGTNIVAYVGTNSFSITTNGFDKLGQFPNGTFRTANANTIGTITTTPAVISGYGQADSSRFNVSAANGRMTNLVALKTTGNFSYSLTGDEASDASYLFALYTNGVLYTPSQRNIFTTAGAGAAATSDFPVDFPANTWMEVRVSVFTGTADASIANGCFRIGNP